MKLLLDTCLLSELQKKECDPSVSDFMSGVNDDQLFLSVITVGEITKGVSLLPDSQRKCRLEEWRDAMCSHYRDRILPISSETAMIWGKLTAKSQSQGVSIPAADGLIAATAIQFGLHVVTRNESDFATTGAWVLNPWKL